MKTILIVCKGNIYRSVIAELCMQKEIKKIGKEDTISVVSRSLQGTMGLPLPKHLNLQWCPPYPIMNKSALQSPLRTLPKNLT